MTKIALIGTGPCGLSFLRSLHQAQKNGENIPEVVAFDKQSDWGGIWRLSSK
jgi:trimethylamine monooxygenase